MERNARGQLLQDEGTQPRLAMTGIRSWGVPPESAWPFVEANVNTEPPMDVLARASAFKLANWYRIDAQGNGRIDDVCQALAAKHPIILGVEVDDAFENYQRGQVLTAPTSQTYGGHMLCLVGYRTVNGVKQFRGVNSWGTGWGDRGLFWADSAWLTDPRAGDLYVLVVTGV
jgi:C1A family cysteine protease